MPARSADSGRDRTLRQFLCPHWKCLYDSDWEKDLKNYEDQVLSTMKNSQQHFLIKEMHARVLLDSDNQKNWPKLLGKNLLVEVLEDSLDSKDNSRSWMITTLNPLTNKSSLKL